MEARPRASRGKAKGRSAPRGKEAEEVRAARKRADIVEAAATVFLRNGYVGTSMDEIAFRAKVSKQTVYNHFVDKETLFRAIVVATVEEAGEPVHAGVIGLEHSTNLEHDLRELARQQL